jgi:hypothetical protein
MTKEHEDIDDKKEERMRNKSNLQRSVFGPLFVD